MNTQNRRRALRPKRVRASHFRDAATSERIPSPDDRDPHCSDGKAWVRLSLRQLDYLSTVRSIDLDAVAVIEFAIRWAPFGGASAGDLLVAFGVGPQRFMELVRAELQPGRGDYREARWLKGVLMDALNAAWRIDDLP
ncbi:hypothetical protein AB0L62_08025 [Nocardia asteroides]|uniref:hypothetical protein n=1 Tax=Nocardia asteroides TaxID=1824 RepID=UPI003444FB7A